MKRPLNHFLPPTDQEISADEVRELPLGSKVRIHGNDRHGMHQWTDCTVAGHHNRKFLTYRDLDGMVKHCQIKDYPNKYYTKVV